jgi:hypothetical protein
LPLKKLLNYENNDIEVRETVSSFLSKAETGIDNSNATRKAIEILKKKRNKTPAATTLSTSGGQRKKIRLKVKYTSLIKRQSTKYKICTKQSAIC